MISPSAEFYSKPPKRRKVETMICWMFQILSYGTTKGEGGLQVSEHTFTALCTSENISCRAWISFKTLVVFVGR